MYIIKDIGEFRQLIEENRQKTEDLLIKTISIGQYKVYSPNSKNWYDLKCGVLPNGSKFYSCSCIAGGFDKVCKHGYKAVDHHIMLKQRSK